ncbi:MAG TPA: VPLPA-CTERM sorting domain-containing protein [Geobacteraceae bacterium]|nr:VPLPA-CTERM sorting domain-containing protein [Geobacteraceae bacterium]
MRKTLASVFLMCFLTVAFVSSSEAATFTVNANPLWTDTGIDLNGKAYKISGALGTWSWEGGVITDANGTTVSVSDTSYLNDEWIRNGQHGQLIGFVGDANLDPNANPRQISQGDIRLFAIGTGSVTLSGLTGRLWLGMNDDFSSFNTGDNSGSVTVSVAPVPVPAAFWLLGSALLCLVGIRRKRI